MISDRRAFSAVCIAICKSGKFETGEGTCAPICMSELGDVRSRPCAYAIQVHQKLAEAIITAIDANP